MVVAAARSWEVPMRTLILTALMILAYATVNQASAQKSPADPFAYCKTKRNTDLIQDAPGLIQDAPKVILDALKTNSAWWRCKDGEVYGCQTGASGRACARWDPSKKPTQAIRQACSQHP